MRCYLVLVAALVLQAGTIAQAGPPVIVSRECAAFRVAGQEPWSALLSFATCIQDASVPHVESVEQLEPMLAELDASLAGPLRLYATAVDRAPDPIKVRAAYFIAVAHVSILVRARMALGDHSTPMLRFRLEGLLQRPGRTAWILFDAIDRVVLEDPARAPDAVTRAMVRSARVYKRSLTPTFAPRGETVVARP
ncbi:MAG: hypothetical protein ABI867_15595 [Kofleriaceae bacterium]